MIEIIVGFTLLFLLISGIPARYRLLLFCLTLICLFYLFYLGHFNYNSSSNNKRMLMLSWREALIMFGIVVLIFGRKKLINITKSLGSSINS